MRKLIASLFRVSDCRPAMRGHQVIAARALLELTQAQLSELAGVARTTINNIENEQGDPRLSSLDALEGYFKKRGIKFIDTPGVIGTKPVGLGTLNDTIS
jgi:DNA-binding XRE family transcriptional regulator